MGGQFTKVMPGLYMGSNENARNESELIAHAISHILTVQSTEALVDKKRDHIYHTVFVGRPDGKSLLRVIPETNDFIHNARLSNGNVLVHSESGVSSNVAVVAAYIMSVYELTSTIAIQTIQGLIHAAQPVHDLRKQLDYFEGLPTPPGHPTPNCTAASEHQRLIQKYGELQTLEKDMKFLDAALEERNQIKASGIDIPNPAITEATANLPMHSPPPRIPSRPRAPKPVPSNIGDGEFDFAEAHGSYVDHETPPDSLPDLDDLSISSSSSINNNSGGGIGGGSSSINLRQHEDDIAGSIPMARSISGHTRGGAIGGAQRMAASYQQPPPLPHHHQQHQPPSSSATSSVEPTGISSSSYKPTSELSRIPDDPIFDMAEDALNYCGEKEDALP